MSWEAPKILPGVAAKDTAANFCDPLQTQVSTRANHNLKGPFDPCLIQTQQQELGGLGDRPCDRDTHLVVVVTAVFSHARAQIESHCGAAEVGQWKCIAW